MTATKSERYPTLESVRFIAAMLVVFHHAASTLGEQRSGRFSVPAGVGDVGVSIFFVLSGFLIVRPFILAARNQDPLPNAFRFMWKRALRVFPAYWLALAFFAIFGTVEFNGVTDALRYMFLLQIYDRYTAIGGLTQSWSLAVEVTFYLIVPFLGVAISRLHRKWGDPSLWIVPGVLIVSGYVARWGLSTMDRPGMPSTTREISFLWLPTNIDQFGFGMSLAVASVLWAKTDLRRRLGQSLPAWWSAAIVLIIGYAYLIGPASFEIGYTGGFWQRRQLVYSVVGLLFVLPCALGDHTGRIRRALASPVVTWAGILSYGLYLWHLDWLKLLDRWITTPGRSTAFAFASDPPTSWMFYVTVATALAYIAAAISWFVVEQPIAALRDIGRPKRVEVLEKPGDEVSEHTPH